MRKAVVGSVVGVLLAVGLGAAMVPHGERIWVEDPPSAGARFVFTLPLTATNGARH